MLPCFGGWPLDALHVQVDQQGKAGLIGTVTLLISSFGGRFSDALCDG